jgi:hypothetical protein
MADFGYLTDIFMNLKDLNLKLQGKNCLVNNLHDQVKAFGTRLRLWKIELDKVTSHTSNIIPI